ncbi:hypothetical protein MKEN_01262600 [Mycena kentingensis (nom. inval.)]|nr:hypothetical protein MKEN_01262600 [Mycena kentingensis (nom. inval.)]
MSTMSAVPSNNAAPQADPSKEPAPPNNSVWGLYVKLQTDHSKNLASQWKGDMSAILIFAGLFSSSLTTFLIESYRTLTPDPNEALMLQLTQLVLAQTNATLPPITVSASSNFRTPTSALICNTLWFSSLAFSLICALSATMVDNWARNYILAIENSAAVHKRARMAAYLNRGVRIFAMNGLVELIPTLLHISLLLFFAGLVEFLRPVNTTLSNLVLGMLILCSLLYFVATLLPILYSHCPYYTPLSGLWWRALRELGLLRREDDGIASSYVYDSMSQAREADATRISPERDNRDLESMRWTLSNLREDEELEEFLDFVPQMISSIDYSAKLLLHQLLHDRDLSISLRYRIPRLLRTCGDGNMSARATHKRAATCLHAIWALGMMAVPVSVALAEPSRAMLPFDEKTLIDIRSKKDQNPGISDVADSAASVIARDLLDLLGHQAAAMEGELRTALFKGEWPLERLAACRKLQWSSPRVSVLPTIIKRQLQTLEQLLESVDHATAPGIYMVAEGLRKHLDDLITEVAASDHEQRPLTIEALDYVESFQSQLNIAGLSLTIDYIATIVQSSAAILPYEAFNTLRRLFLKITTDAVTCPFPAHSQSRLVSLLDAALEQNPTRGTWLPPSIINIVLQLASFSLSDPGCAVKARAAINHYINVLPAALIVTRDTALKAIAQLSRDSPTQPPISDLLSSHMYANTKLAVVVHGFGYAETRRETEVDLVGLPSGSTLDSDRTR